MYFVLHSHLFLLKIVYKKFIFFEFYSDMCHVYGILWCLMTIDYFCESISMREAICPNRVCTGWNIARIQTNKCIENLTNLTNFYIVYD